MHGIERLKHSPETSVSVVFIISFSSFLFHISICVTVFSALSFNSTSKNVGF